MPACSDRFVISMPGWEKARDPLTDGDRRVHHRVGDPGDQPDPGGLLGVDVPPVNIRSAAWLEPTARGSR